MSEIDYSWWQSVLAGDWQPLAPDEPAKPGFYRRRLFAGKLAPWAAVAIYPNEAGELIALQDKRLVIGVAPVPVESVWPGCARYPIPEEEYRAVAEEGRPWGSGLDTYNMKRAG